MYMKILVFFKNGASDLQLDTSTIASHKVKGNLKIPVMNIVNQ